jgi:hypothetical protein
MLGEVSARKILRYSLQDYPFVHLVEGALAEHLGDAPLDELGASCPVGPRWQRETDQQSIWHKAFYSAFHGWKRLWSRFIVDEIAPMIGEPFIYQAVPTFRVHLPGNVAVGEFHTDGDYNHPVGEINFWLPLTKAWGSNTVWVESNRGSGRYQPLEVAPGEVAIFDAIHLRHGNYCNRTGKTRVSFDFRCLPVRFAQETEAASVNTGMRFVRGGYYHPEIVSHLKRDEK